MTSSSSRGVDTGQINSALIFHMGKVSVGMVKKIYKKVVTTFEPFFLGQHEKSK